MKLVYFHTACSRHSKELKDLVEDYCMDNGIDYTIYDCDDPLFTPHSPLLTPHSSLPTPHSSLLTPHSSLLTPHSPRPAREM